MPNGRRRLTRECLAIDAAGSIRSRRVIELLTQVISAHGAPSYLRSDNVLNAIAGASFGNKHPLGARWRVDDIKERVLHRPVVFRSRSGGLA